MRLFITLSILCSIFLFSCQKEADFSNNNSNNNGGGGGTTSGSMLVKTVSKNGSDSVVTIYTYNSSKKLINQKITGMEQGIDETNEYRYYRNSSGILTHYVQINATLAGVGIDSATTFVHYNTSSSRYTSTVSALSYAGIDVLDSTFFVYDGSGKIIREDIYQGIPSLNLPYTISLKYKYSYSSNGNISQIDVDDLSSGTEDLVATLKYTYDTKTSPLILDNEAFAIGHADWVATNNAIKSEFVDVTDPSNNITIIGAYTYNSSNKPLTSIVTQNPGAIVRNVSFYYQ
jgi:hypothetical protein